MISSPIKGLHHVTAICGDPQINFDFYTRVLGLRFVKRTVNFDDPFTYHFYYADGSGTPGSVLTFFPWAGQPRGRSGTGQAGATAFAIAPAALEYWQARLTSEAVAWRGPIERMGETCLEFSDPDGLPLELVAAATDAFQTWTGSPVPPEMQLRGFHGVTLAEAGAGPSEALLTEQMGWKLIGRSGGRTRYQAPGGGPASLVDVLAEAGAPRGMPGTGTVHHVAFRAADDAAQLSWRQALVSFGHHVSEVRDRSYFHSIYFREPGGILFEIATDNPGFAVDEPLASLGTALKLPPQFERARAQIEAHLPPLRARQG